MPLQWDRGLLRRIDNPFVFNTGAVLGHTANQSCCCGEGPPPPPLYIRLTGCSGAHFIYALGGGFGGIPRYNVWIYQGECYYIADWDEIVANANGPIVTIFDVQGPIDTTRVPVPNPNNVPPNTEPCTAEVCTSPPPPPPPPPPDDPPCGECGAEGVCDFCTCTPATTIKCGISGTTNCACVGPCGNGPSYKFARIAQNWSLDGVYDLNSVGDCEWQGFVGLRLWTGSPFDSTCSEIDETIVVTLHLKKLTATHWVFSAYVQAMSDYDPRDFDPGNDIENFRLFTGSATVDANRCMTIPSMNNELACVCRHTDTSDGRFDLTTGGVASFDTCPPYVV